MLSNLVRQWHCIETNIWLMPTCGLCNYPPENNGYCCQNEVEKVINVTILVKVKGNNIDLQVHLDNFVNSFFKGRMQLWPFSCSWKQPKLQNTIFPYSSRANSLNFSQVKLKIQVKFLSSKNITFFYMSQKLIVSKAQSKRFFWLAIVKTDRFFILWYLTWSDFLKIFLTVWA